MIFTAQFRYSGPGRVDITYKTTSDIGRVFAPTKAMVHGIKYGRLTEDGYKEQYFALLDARAIATPSTFNLLAQIAEHSDSYLVLVCYCPAGVFCHRLLLMEYMEAFGMPYTGEVVL